MKEFRYVRRETKVRSTAVDYHLRSPMGMDIAL